MSSGTWRVRLCIAAAEPHGIMLAMEARNDNEFEAAAKNIFETELNISNELVKNNTMYDAVYHNPFTASVRDRLHDFFSFWQGKQYRTFIIVGSGPLPVTAWSVAELFAPAEIIALDIDIHAIENGRALSKRFGFSSIQFERTDGSIFDYHDADGIFVANFISHKPLVVDRILDTLTGDCDVTVRSNAHDRFEDERLVNLGTGSLATRFGSFDRYCAVRPHTPSRNGQKMRQFQQSE